MADPARISRQAAPALPGRERRELHLFPGEKRLLFIIEAKLVIDVEAWGGPEFPIPKRPGEPFGATPTPAGRFRIGRVGPYRTSSWRWSKLRWGVRLQRAPSDDTDVLYEAGPGKWSSVRKKTSLSRQEIEKRYFSLYGRTGLPSTWLFNDFGPIAVRFYRDRNNNKKQDPSEHLQGEMFHTTAENEAEGGNTSLFESHGCIHLRPIERDRLIELKAFERGTLLVIHDYGETSGVGRRATAGRP